MYVFAISFHPISVARLCLGGHVDSSAGRSAPLFSGTIMMPASVVASFATVKLPLLDWFENFKSGDKRSTIYPTAAAASVAVCKYPPGNGGFPRQRRWIPVEHCRCWFWWFRNTEAPGCNLSRG